MEWSLGEIINVGKVKSTERGGGGRVSRGSKDVKQGDNGLKMKVVDAYNKQRR